MKILIDRDVTSGCPGGRRRCTAVNGETGPTHFKIPAVRMLYRIFYFSERSVKIELSTLLSAFVRGQ